MPGILAHPAGSGPGSVSAVDLEDPEVSEDDDFCDSALFICSAVFSWLYDASKKARSSFKIPKKT
jgi:hypothetical protein